MKINLILVRRSDGRHGIGRWSLLTSNTSFLQSVDQNFCHAMTFLDPPEGLAERIIQCNSTYN